MGFFLVIPSVCETTGLRIPERIVRYSKRSGYPHLSKTHTHTHTHIEDLLPLPKLKGINA